MPHYSLKRWHSRIDDVEDICARVAAVGAIIPRHAGARAARTSRTESYIGSPSPPASFAQREPGEDNDDEAPDEFMRQEGGYKTLE